VTGPERGGALPRLCVTVCVRLAGGRAVQLYPSSTERSVSCEGVVVTGGHDVDPVLYAAEPEVTPRYDPERDAFESRIIDEALAAGQPILGICRGAQLLNIRLGGSLHQDLSKHRRLTSKRRTILPLKSVLIESGSVLHGVLRSPEARVNSLHDQAIDRLGKGLAVSARDRDGIVQAVERRYGVDHRGPFVVGVQWHPEFLFFLSRQRRLFAALVAATLDRRAGAGSQAA
jgi:putative glutamine amidotransferase